MALTQTHFRFRTDANAVDTTPTWGADEDASPSPATTPFRLRVGLNSTATASGEFEIYAKKNAGSYAAITTSATGGLQSYDASSDADDTMLRTPRLTLSTAWWLAGAAIDLDFSGNRIYPSGAFSDYLSCSRASVGYAKNSSDILAQFSSDTLRITDLGLLVEDARTNILTSSQAIGTGLWNDNGANMSNTQNYASAPDGTTTATRIMENGTTNTEYQYNMAAGDLSVAPYTFSVYLKAGSLSWVLLAGPDDGSNYGAYFNLSNGTIGTVTDARITASIEALANGWYRCIIVDSTPVNPNNFCHIFTASGDGAKVHTGVVGADILAWGAQLELGSFPSSYIPTTTTSAARAADVIIHAGTLQTDIAAATASIVAQVTNGESNNFAANIIDSNGTNLLGFDTTNHGLASITASLATGNTGNRTTRDKLGIAWDGSGRSLVLNGGTVATDASAQTPNSTQHIGSSGTDKFAFAYIERLTVWTSKLAGASLQGFASL